MSYRKYKTWDESFRECAENKYRMDHLNMTASKLFPLENGELRTSFAGLTPEQRDIVREESYNQRNKL